MKVNTKTRYGIRAMVEIAKYNDQGGIFQKDIAKNQDISNKYLDHIISGLKIANLVRKKDKRAGYVLTREASEITIYDINNAFEANLCIIECFENGVTCEKEGTCEVIGFWSELNNLIINHYKSVTLQDLIENPNHLEDHATQKNVK